jgi:hypothetical protein
MAIAMIQRQLLYLSWVNILLHAAGKSAKYVQHSRISKQYNKICLSFWQIFCEYIEIYIGAITLKFDRILTSSNKPST